MDAQFPLQWIDKAVLVKIAETRFSSGIRKFLKSGAQRSDPTSFIARSLLYGMDQEELRIVDQNTAVLKTLQNNIGLFHQDVLGSVPGWRQQGASGGIYDIESLGEVELAGNRKVIAEIKMRFNTIKASDEHLVWDKLKDAVASRGGKDECVAYLVQLIPKDEHPYDRPWKVSNRPEREEVRAIDGVTAYHMVTGDPNALHDLFYVLPEILAEAFTNIDESLAERFDLDRVTNRSLVEEAILQALPGHSAL